MRKPPFGVRERGTDDKLEGKKDEDRIKRMRGQKKGGLKDSDQA